MAAKDKASSFTFIYLISQRSQWKLMPLPYVARVKEECQLFRLKASSKVLLIVQ